MPSPFTDISADYNTALAGVRGASLKIDDTLVGHLIELWQGEYAAKHPPADDIVVVDLPVGGAASAGARPFGYLFDIPAGRLIAAWGLSDGRKGWTRDHSRMRGHPLGGPTGTHRGHALPHRMGGGLDINLVPQLGSVNVSQFRVLERLAVRTPGALYFTRWNYPAGSATQRAASVDQGFFQPGRAGRVRNHPN